MLTNNETGVIIVTHNDWEKTLACLERVHCQTSPPRRIVVCENGSENTMVNKLREGWLAIATTHPLNADTPAQPVEMFACEASSAPLVLLRLEENQGLAGGLNAALNVLLYDQGCQAFWILHNDTLPEIYTLAALLRHSGDEIKPAQPQKNSPAPLPMGIVGSTLLLPDKDLLECAGGGTWNRWFGTIRLLDEGVLRYALTDRKELVDRMDFVNGTSFLLTRELIDCIGLFDEALFLFQMDVDYSLRAKKAGFALNWAPGAVVQHNTVASDCLTPMLAVREEPKLSPASDYMNIRNRFYLLRKYRPWALPLAMVTMPLPLSWRMFRGQKERLRMVLQAAWHGARGRMNNNALKFT